MIYLIGGAPRVGKSVLTLRLSSRLGIGWISTDLLAELLRLKGEPGIKKEWDATPEAVAASAEWFFPYLERFVWGVGTMSAQYIVEGVDLLPAQVARLAETYQVRSVFLGRSEMTLETLDQFPGRSPGYSFLPETMRRRIAEDVPQWSVFIRQECERFGYRYVDMAGDFAQSLQAAEEALVGDGTRMNADERG